MDAGAVAIPYLAEGGPRDNIIPRRARGKGIIIILLLKKLKIPSGISFAVLTIIPVVVSVCTVLSIMQ